MISGTGFIASTTTKMATTATTAMTLKTPTTMKAIDPAETAQPDLDSRLLHLPVPLQAMQRTSYPSTMTMTRTHRTVSKYSMHVLGMSSVRLPAGEASRVVTPHEIRPCHKDAAIRLLSGLTPCP